MGYPPNFEEDPRSYPAARKPDSGNDPNNINPASPLLPGWNQPPPLNPDHLGGTAGQMPNSGFSDYGAYNEPMTGDSPPDSGWQGGQVFGDLSGPYGSPVAGGPILPPPPPTTGAPFDNDPQKRRRRALLLLLTFFTVFLVAGLVFLVALNKTQPKGTGNPTPITNYAAVATDTPFPTPTLLPGQTPLPTPIPPTATPVPVAGAPTATPIPYASSATVTFDRATQAAIAPSGQVTVSTTASDPNLKVTASPNEILGSDAINAIVPDVPPDYHPATGYSATVLAKNTTGGTQNIIGNITAINASTFAPILCAIQTPGGNIQINNGQQFNITCSFNAGITPAFVINFVGSNGVQYSDGTGGSPDAGGGSILSYTVPSGCGELTAAKSNANAKLEAKLNSDVAGTTVYFSSGTSYSNIACSPAAGTTIPNSSNAYTQTISASGSRSGYNPGGVQDYQKSLVSVDNGWKIISKGNCSPTVGTKSLTSATISCPISGSSEAYNSYDLDRFASFMARLDTGTAKANLTKEPYIAGNINISLSGGSFMPYSANNIKIIPNG